jgi:cell division protein FtsL
MRESGNLAIEPEFFDGGQLLDGNNLTPSLARRLLLEEEIVSRPQLQEKARQIRRTMAVRRLRSLVGLITLILAVTGIFGGILYRQARILEMNFANLRLEREISKTNQLSGQISESLARETNLEQIRREAVERLGLQEPAQKQIVTVYIPNSDRVVYASAAQQKISDEARLSHAFAEIEGFFKTLNLSLQDP